MPHSGGLFDQSDAVIRHFEVILTILDEDAERERLVAEAKAKAQNGSRGA